jgi:hypothetical protein
MARPKKESVCPVEIDEIEHLSDRYYELFDQLAKVDSEKNPDEYFRLERETEDEWFRSVESPRERGIIQRLFPGSQFSEYFTEAEWIFSVALEEAIKCLAPFKGKVDIDGESQEVALFVVDYYRRIDSYDHMLPKAKKQAFIKRKTKHQSIDVLRRLKKNSEQAAEAEKVFSESRMTDREVADLGNRRKRPPKKSEAA